MKINQVKEKVNDVFLKIGDSYFVEDTLRRKEVSKQMNEVIQRSKILEGGTLSSRDFCDTIKIQKQVHNISSIILPKIVGNYQYNVHFKGYKKSEKEFIADTPKLGGGSGWPGVDLREFSKDLALLLKSEGNDFFNAFTKVLGHFGIGLAIISGYLYLIRPDDFPLVNGASIKGMEILIGEQTSSQIKKYAEKEKTRYGILETIKNNTFRKYLGWSHLIRKLLELDKIDNFYTADALLWKINQMPPIKQSIWWVNQGINLAAEKEGGFLWAPIKNKSGKSFYHWDTMQEIKVGDVVVHYANGNVRHVSRVVESAVEEKRPESFGDQTWEENGRLVRVEYHELDPPISLVKFNQRLRQLNIYQGPIDNTGGIKQGYLFRFTPEAMSIVQESQPDTLWPEFSILNDISLEHNTWIFQANPNYYDLEASLKVLKEHRWTINRYKDKIQVGDTIYLWQSGTNAGIYAIGTVMTKPELMPEDEKELKFSKSPEKFDKPTLRSIVKVNKVLKTPVLRDDLLKESNLSDLLILRQPAGTNFPVTTEQDGILKDLINKIDKITTKKNWGEIKDSLNYRNVGQAFKIDDLIFENKDQIQKQIQVVLQNGKNIILIGPPGTGKSKLAVSICENYCGTNNYIMSTATSDWSTFETIGGYRPDREGDLIFHPGIFLQCFHDKESRPINKWLIIDEINRADIDKAFGSIFSALTGDDITLPFDISGEQLKVIGDPKDDMEIMRNQFIIHPHWRIIATMNTFDKTSLYEMSYAFMRRFAFVPIDVPININSDLIEKYLDIWGFEVDELICKNLSTLWNLINSKRKIGPAILQDLYRYIQETDPNDYVSGIIMYVLPQFEGLSEEILIEFIKEVLKLKFMNNPKALKNFASEFFGLDIKKFE